MVSEELKIKTQLYAILDNILQKYHFARVDSEVSSKHFPMNPILELLTCFLDTNHLLIGDPGWGKTTSAKIFASAFTKIPFDLYDSTEIRGNPHAYEEKIVGRFDFHELQKTGEKVLWKAGLALPVLICDEANWLPEESQATILQGIETGRYNYGNETMYEGKRPSFLAINQRSEDRNGFLPALEDRMDICTAYESISTIDLLFVNTAKEQREKDLCHEEFTNEALEKLKESIEKFKEFIKKKKEYHQFKELKEQVKYYLGLLSFDDDAKFFLQSLTSEINFNNRYGVKRSADPISDETHDKNHVGVYFKNSLSPRTFVSIQKYSTGLAWLLDDKKVTKDHVKLIAPYAIHHKSVFTDDYKNEKAGDQRRFCETLYLAKKAVEKADQNYMQSVDPLKNLIAKIQDKKLTPKEIKDLNPDEFDHPLLKDLIRKLKEPKAFYSQ